MSEQQYTRENFAGSSFSITLDNSRDAKLTDFGKTTMKDRYLQPGETFQELFGRVAVYFANDESHAQRLYDAISNLWFMPATPILSNGGLPRGNPISCFLNAVGDSLESIDSKWSENVWLAARGGGIGTYWGDVRSIGEKVGDVGETSGVIPFMKVQDSMTLGISQGSLRRGSSAAYLDVSHPEIEEFIDIRRPTGDPNRRCLNLHHGVNIPDAFMEAVREDGNWDLISPKTGAVIRTVRARTIWQKILAARIETGEPYILFTDTVNKAIPEHQKRLGLKVKQSNLCSEITLPTGVDHLGVDRTAVCCLSSLNAETSDEWFGNRHFVQDVMMFLDNVLTDFINRTNGAKGFENARYSAARERSIGLGMMGFQSYCQKNGQPMDSLFGKMANKRIWSWLKETGDEFNEMMAEERGPCPDAADAGVMKYWSNIFSVAPTASISIICGTTSPSVEPIAANVFAQKTLSGTFIVRNRHLDALLRKRYVEQMGEPQSLSDGEAMEDFLKGIWKFILDEDGSVKNVTFLTQEDRDIFKTAFEIDPRWLIDFAADRAPHICQAASNNLFLPANISARDLHMIHFKMWEKGVKSLYYCRSLALARADRVGHVAGEMPDYNRKESEPADVNYDECMVCQ